MTAEPVLMRAPSQGVWRLGWAHDPIRYNQVEPETFDGSSAGRFSLFSYETLYCASKPAGCYAEALALYRVSPRMRALMQDAPANNDQMALGAVPSSWRDLRILVRLTASPQAQFLDLEAEQTRVALTEELGDELQAFGVQGLLTEKDIQGKDRTVTRQIAAWAIAQRNAAGHQLMQGITYRSSYGGYRCWAILRDAELHEQERRPIKQEDVALREVAAEYGITVW
ncbi:RES domain-containing protein [Streptomyces sp. NPDC056975]|uniref:RES domain-containing protein n=1 Tax=Streptomyces sp. NPDC056975 TaxID=3345985 RepID=UPI003632EB5D